MSARLRSWTSLLSSPSLAARAAVVAHLALPVLVALLLPPRNLLRLEEGIVELKLTALRWGYAVAAGVVAGLLLLRKRVARETRMRQDTPDSSWHRRRDILPLIFLSGLFLWSIVSLVSSENLWLGWRQESTFFFPAGFVLLTAWAGLALPAGRFLAAAGAAGIVIGLGLVAQNYGLNPFEFAYSLAILNPDARAQLIATLGNPEYVGGYLAPLVAGLLVVALSLPRSGKRGALRRLAAGAAFVMLGALVLSGTRSALLALAGGLGVGIASCDIPWRELRRSRVLLAAGALLLILAILFSFPNPVNRRFARYFSRLGQLVDWQSPSVTERFLFNMAGAELLNQNPLLGVGAGLFNTRYNAALQEFVERDPDSGLRLLIARTSEKGAGHAHNDYLEFAAETGWPGLLLFLGFAVALLLARPPGRAGPMLPSLRAALAAFFVSALFSFPLQTPGRATLFWGLVAAMLSELRSPAANRESLGGDSAPTSAA